RRLPEQSRSMKSLYSWIGFKKKAVPVDQEPRLHGQSKFNFFRLLNLALDGITSFTTAPLRLATIVGALCALAALLSFCWFFAGTLLYGNPVPGYPSLFCGILFFGGVQLLGLGIIGEYLGRVFIETKGRPLYIVAESNLPGEPQLTERWRRRRGESS
ncbi:MAG: glycosyltransferase, partial [Pyramidobacter sp.]|nr:glycosyltransferase [Pyramidobacter sp.]